MSNNASKARSDFVTKLTKMRFPAEATDIFSSAYAAAMYIKSRHASGPVYMIGTAGLRSELEAADVQVIDQGSEHVDGILAMQGVELNPSVKAVVVGLDPRLTYSKLAIATAYLARENVEFIACNTDSTFPAIPGLKLPGAGSIVASVATATGMKPTVLGKPEPLLLQLLMNATQPSLQPHRTIMVGDRMDTDIQFGLAGGLNTLLVLTGVASLEDARAKAVDCQPHYYTGSLGDIAAMYADA